MAMISHFRDGHYEGIERTVYKDEPGTWVGITRTLLSEGAQCGFDVRYFEIGPEGHSSYERHVHEHCVVVIRGSGDVYLNGEWHCLQPGDYVHVAGMAPHQFRCRGTEPFGFLCVVDSVRDKSESLGEPPTE